MSTADPGVRTFAFGDLTAGVWVTARVPATGEPGLASLVAPGGSEAPIPATVSAPDEVAEWVLSGAGFELAFAPAGDEVELDLRDAGLIALDQPCHVSGAMNLGGVAYQLDGRGSRGHRSQPDWSRLASVRELAAWVEGDSSVVVIAARPRRARGHDADVAAGFLFGADAPTVVNEPRLSTTYDRGGLPAKAGLELWIGDDEHEYPRRAAGEAASSANVIRNHASLRTWIPFRWRMAGAEGAGSYELLEPASDQRRS